MAKELIVDDLIKFLSNVSASSTVDIGVDSIDTGEYINYNLSVIIRFDGDMACTIFSKDIQEQRKDSNYREARELFLLTELYLSLYEHIKSRNANLSLDINNDWFDRDKFENRVKTLKIRGLNDN